MIGSYYTNKYENYFLRAGFSEKEVNEKIETCFNEFFYGTEDTTVYYEVEPDMAYVTDTGNDDVRTEGMSYAMMIFIQLNKKNEFDRIWKWVKTYMWMSEGKNAGYFAWSCKKDGTKNSDGPAPDGEEFFAMSLFFAANRWGNGEGIFNYEKEAKEILHVCIHKGQDGSEGFPMWEHSNYLIKFIPECDFTDPSYHLPHFYELFSLWANEEDKSFWSCAATASREYLKKSCHPITGLSPEYAEYDGTPHFGHQEIFGRHDWYYSDSYRTIANIALDFLWFADDSWEIDIANKHQKFFCETVKEQRDMIYLIDGTVLPEKALHPIAMIATNAQASLASDGKYSKKCIEEFFKTPMRKGKRRYYDNFLYLFALLSLSGNYRIWK